MTRASCVSLLFGAVALGAGLGACGGGDPGDGSSDGPAQVWSTGANEDAGDAGYDLPDVQGFPPILVADSSVTPSPSDAASDAPAVSLSAGDGGCQLPDLVCAGPVVDGGEEGGPSGAPRCVDVTNDPLNCGGCGHVCAGPSASCIGGSCACSELGFLYCPAAGSCVDTTGDVNNCGSCGYVCDSSQFNACASGLCVMN